MFAKPFHMGKGTLLRALIDAYGRPTYFCEVAFFILGYLGWASAHIL